MSIDINSPTPPPDGVHAMVPREQMTESARRLRDTYAITPGTPLIRTEFGFYCMERWHTEDGLPEDANLSELFQYDETGSCDLWGLGWCEAAFLPAFEEKVLEDRGDYELVQDFAGRSVLCFKGRRSGFMPEYLDHPVKDWKTWEENVKWRLSSNTAERFASLDKWLTTDGRKLAGQGYLVQQRSIGGYMYLRSLIGPVELLYMVHDSPDLIHDCMKTWFELADAVIAKHQEHLTLDELFLAEDICYNHGPLISPEMMREFLLPYYQQLISNIKKRQIDQSRHLHLQIDTDGYAVSVIPVYQELGMDVMSPFEVASGCDVVEIGRQHPNLVIRGGIDKRVLATTKEQIDQYLERVLPPMRARGGYIPHCDHGVPAEVSLENYLHYRKRCIELGG